MNNQCEQFERILEQQDEDGLPKSVLAHMESCEVCRALSEDFTAIHDMALEIGHEGVAPPERVWISLRNQLEAEGLIKDSTDDAPVETPLKPGWWSAFQRPALAGAFLGVMLAAAATAGYLSNFAPKVAQLEFTHPQETSPALAADNVFKEEVLTVGDESIPGLQRQDTAVTASLRRNLQIVDNFIAMCEKSVHEQPDNQMAREYLYGAYQQKAELLATATNRSLTGGLQ